MKPRKVAETMLAGCLAMLLVAPLVAQELAATGTERAEQKEKKEVYSATGFSTGSGANSLSLTIYIDDYSTDAETHALAETLKSGGSDAVLKAMDKIKPEKGRVAVVGRTGNQVKLIRTRPLGNGKRRIFLVTDRPLSFLELRQGTRSRDYEFGVIELVLDAKGKGEGVALAAAKIWFDKKGELKIEPYGTQPVRLVNVYKF